MITRISNGNRDVRKSVLLMTVATTLILSVGCTTKFVPTAYKTLIATETTYDAILEASNDLYQKKVISETDKNRIIVVANAFQKSYEVAVAALAAYNETKGKPELEMAYKSIESLLNNFDKLVALYSAFSGGTVPGIVVSERKQLEKMIE